MEITLDRQAITQHCPECNDEFTVVRGSVYDAGTPFGLYLVALHGHSPQGRIAHLGVAVLDHSGGPPQAVAMDIIATPDQIGFTAIDWSNSPWRDEAYLGEMLDREQALASPSWSPFLRIAEHVVGDLPEVATYFAS